jgi:23S rRNA pseudouridine2605 synthase
MPERLQKILARAGVASRRAAETLIVEGRVTVNGVVVDALGARADATTDRIAVDGVAIQRRSSPVYLMLHKPQGYVTTHDDPQGRPTVYELLPDIPGLFSVGRLDLETEGLLLLTTDGEWAEHVAHPRYGVEREYEVRVAGLITPDILQRLRDGIMLDGKPARPVAAYEAGRAGMSSILTVVMVEGRRREVRLLCAGVGLRVKRLVRRRVGPVLLGWLAEGHWRHLSAQEVAALGTQYGRMGRARQAARRDQQEQDVYAGEGESTHRDRRAGGVRQVDDRAHPRQEPGFPVSRHGRDVQGRDGGGPGSAPRSE